VSGAHGTGEASQGRNGRVDASIAADARRRDLRCRIAQLFLCYGEAEGLRWLLLNLQNHPNHRPSHLALADYYDQQGQAARAAAHRRLAGQARDGM
jgi:hypothetical protein